MTRFQKLAAWTLATAIVLVTVGVIVRATDSGLGCPDWPLCYGQVVPPRGDPKAWLEWIHRDIAVIIGFMILGLAALAVRDHRDRPSLPKNYTIFGKLTSGEDVLDRIATAKTGAQDRPAEPVSIKKVTITES